VAREWYGKNVHAWTKKHASTVIRRLELYIFPPLGKRPVKQIAAPELLEALRKVEARGVLESAHRTKQICGQVFRYAIATGRAERDPSADLKGALAPVKPVHMAAITDPKKIGGLLRAIDDYDGQFITLCALKLAPFLFVRPGELRQAEWCEVDLDSAEWKIPAEKMKSRATPYCSIEQASCRYFQADSYPSLEMDGIFLPSLRSTARPMSNTYTSMRPCGAWATAKMK
jgi:integrase